MDILFVIHAEFEHPGYFLTWAKNKNHITNIVSPYKGEVLPEVDKYEMIVVMGGPQSPLDKDKANYLYEEIALLNKAINQGKKIVGVCLGAQLIAEALGAKTEKSPNKEIGSYKIELLHDAKTDPVFQNFPCKFSVMHWHSDMPGIPKNAVLIAKSDGCPRQIFRYGDRVYGFQCHLEFTQAVCEGMLKNCQNDLDQPGRYIATARQILETDFNKMNFRLGIVLDYLETLPKVECVQSHSKIAV